MLRIPNGSDFCCAFGKLSWSFQFSGKSPRALSYLLVGCTSSSDIQLSRRTKLPQIVTASAGGIEAQQLAHKRACNAASTYCCASSAPLRNRQRLFEAFGATQGLVRSEGARGIGSSSSSSSNSSNNTGSWVQPRLAACRTAS